MQQNDSLSLSLLTKLFKKLNFRSGVFSRGKKFNFGSGKICVTCRVDRLGFYVVLLFLMGGFFVFGFGAKASAAMYYVANAGNDSCDGTSQTIGSSGACAWKTIAKVNASTFSPGDSILFNKGDAWREQLTVPSSGSAGNPITFGAYGSGEKPIFSGADVISSWTSEASGHENFTDSSGAKPQGWWELTEASGNRIDVNTTNNNTLSQNGGTISHATGPNSIVTNAAHLIAASSQYFSRTDGSLSGGFPGKSTTSGSGVTFGAWVKPGDLSTDREVISKGCDYGLSLVGNVVLFSVYDSGYGNHSVTSSVNVPSGVWSHIVGQWNHTTGALKIYVNGVDVTASPASSATMVQDWGDFQIGKPGDCAGNSFYDGNIAEPFAFATELTSTQIADIYAAGLSGSSSSIYYSPLSSNPRQVFEDTTRLTAVGSKSAISAGSFWWDAVDNRIYIRAKEDTNPSGHTIEVGARDFAMNFNNVTWSGNGPSYITVDEITLRGARSEGMQLQGNQTGVQINNCVSEWNYGAGLHYDDGNAPGTTTGFMINNSIFRYNGGSGLEWAIPAFTGWNITNNQLYSNAQLITDGSGNPFVCTGDGEEHCWDGGMKFYSSLQTGGSGSVISNNVVYSNGITGGLPSQGAGIWADTVSGVFVQDNLIYNNTGSGIYFEKTINSKALYNVLYNNTVGQTDTVWGGANLWIRSGEGLSSTGNLIANNTMYGGLFGMANGNNESDGSISSNNVFRNNIAIGATNQNFRAWPGGNNNGTNGTGNVYDHNSFGVPGSTLAYWTGTGAITTYSGLDSAYGSAMNNVQTDPLFVDASIYNFHLTNTSPAINAGTDVGLTSDYDGNSVPNGLFPDIGAYEFQDITPPSLTITSPTTGHTVSGDDTITFTDSEITAPLCSLDNSHWDACTSGATSFTTLTSWSSISEKDTFTLYLKDTDNANNTGTTQTSNLKKADTIAPVRTEGAPTGELASGTTSTDISLKTNEEATCKYDTSSKDYADLANTFNTTDNLTHTATVDNLTDGNSYTYYVKCQDIALNTNDTDYIISFLIANPQENTDNNTDNKKDDNNRNLNVHQIASSATTDSITLTWKTDYATQDEVRYGPNKNLSNKQKDHQKEKSHKLTIPNLLPNTTYYFKIKSQDGDDNQDTSRIHEIRTTDVSTDVRSMLRSNVSTSGVQEGLINQTSTPSVCSYAVKPGDTLWGISQKVYGNGFQYQKIVELNKDKYPSIGVVLSIGQKLVFGCE